MMWWLVSVLTLSAVSDVTLVTAQAVPERGQWREVTVPATLRADASPDAMFLTSALLPGSAQYLMGDDRWMGYAAAELWGWVSYIQQRRSARSLERRYRDLAWRVPRRISVGERRDTVFEYYEALAHNGASGAFDIDPSVPGVQPERQLETFNGDLWALARALHGNPIPGTPSYDSALQYYLARAIPAAYAWAWGASAQGAPLEQQVFSDLIEESDAAFRSASRYLGLILANHVTSAVDALVTARLRQLAGDAVHVEFGSVPGAHGVRWEYGLRIRF
jgi:hypothetical protein